MCFLVLGVAASFVTTAVMPSRFVTNELVTIVFLFNLGYKDIYSPVTFKCTQEFVLVTFRSHSTLTNRQNITISHV